MTFNVIYIAVLRTRWLCLKDDGKFDGSYIGNLCYNWISGLIL